MLKIDVRDCDKYLPHLADNKNPGDNLIVKENEEQDKELLEKNKFYQKLR
jgi:hypothetical protein